MRPPLVLQKLIFGPLAALARTLGYRPEYRYPYTSQLKPPLS